MATGARAGRRSSLPYLGAATAAIALCAVAGMAGHGRATRHAMPQADTIMARSLAVQDRPDGLTVRIAGSGAFVEHLPIDRDSFVRGVFHSLALLRRAHGVSDAAPYRLAELADGRVLLSDPSTGEQLDVEGFGPNNRAAFLALLGLPVERIAT